MALIADLQNSFKMGLAFSADLAEKSFSADRVDRGEKSKKSLSANPAKGARRAIKNQKKVALIVPIHPPYFHYGINLLYSTIFSDVDIIFVFRDEIERLEFQSQHVSSHYLSYFSFNLTDFIDDVELSIVDSRNTWPTLKKWAALSVISPFYDFAVCVDAETGIINPESWQNASESICNSKTWLGGLCPSDNGNLKWLLQTSGRQLVPEVDRNAVYEISHEWGVYTWWNDLPVYDCRHVPDFLNWIGFTSSIHKVVETLTRENFDHVTYQYFTCLHQGFKINKIPGLVHSLEFKGSSVYEFVHTEIRPLFWTNAKAYAENPQFYHEKGYLAFFHIDRHVWPDYT